MNEASSVGIATRERGRERCHPLSEVARVDSVTDGHLRSNHGKRVAARTVVVAIDI